MSCGRTCTRSARTCRPRRRPPGRWRSVGMDRALRRHEARAVLGEIGDRGASTRPCRCSPTFARGCLTAPRSSRMVWNPAWRPCLQCSAVKRTCDDREAPRHVSGQTEPGTANTCFSDRHNWTMRTMRRDTGRSNGFSLTEAENHRTTGHGGGVDVLLDFVQPHLVLTRKGRLPTRPAMAAGRG